MRVRLWGTSWAHASYVRRADADGKTIGVHPSSLGSSRRFHADSSTLLMSAFRETREGVSEMFASVGTQSKRDRTPREHSVSLTEFAILAMSSLSAYPCTQADFVHDARFLTLWGFGRPSRESKQFDHCALYLRYPKCRR